MDTGIVPPGTTCENRNYINTAASNATSYTLTVIVDYVIEDTRLGVYQYDTSSNSYTLVSEVSTNYTGNITVTVEPNKEVYVLMTPLDPNSCAGYNVSVEGDISNTNSSGCNTCIDNSDQYWCAERAYSTSGYCCNSSVSKSDCIGSSQNVDDYVCSNENLPV